jgi:hypothetical protein
MLVFEDFAHMVDAFVPKDFKGICQCYSVEAENINTALIEGRRASSH